MTEYVFTRSARKDLDAAAGFITDGLSSRLVETVEKLARREFEGRSVTLVTGAAVQVWPVPPFRIYYEWRGEILTVLRIYHGARKPIEG